MARKNTKNPKTTTPTKARVGAAPAAPAAPTAPTQKTNNAIAGSWFEENWDSWLRPVVLIVLAGIFLLLYSTNIIPDFWAAMVVLFVLVVVIWFATISAESKRFPEGLRNTFYGIAAVVALFVWVPVLFAVFPGTPRLLGDLKKKGDAIDLAPLGNTDRYLIVTGGAFFDDTTSNRSVDYTIEGFDGAKKAIHHGKVEQRLEKTQSRRGVQGEVLKIHTQDKSTLTLDPSKPFTLMTEIDPEVLPDGVHVAIYDPPLGGSWLLIGALLFYVVLLFTDLKNVADKGRGYLAAGGGAVLVGALIFCMNSTPYTPFTVTSDLAQLTLIAATLGGVLGAFGGMLLQLIMSKYVKRPPMPDEFAKKEEPA